MGCPSPQRTHGALTAATEQLTELAPSGLFGNAKQTVDGIGVLAEEALHRRRQGRVTQLTGHPARSVRLRQFSGPDPLVLFMDVRNTLHAEVLLSLAGSLGERQSGKKHALGNPDNNVGQSVAHGAGLSDLRSDIIANTRSPDQPHLGTPALESRRGPERPRLISSVHLKNRWTLEIQTKQLRFKSDVHGRPSFAKHMIDRW